MNPNGFEGNSMVNMKHFAESGGILKAKDFWDEKTGKGKTIKVKILDQGEYVKGSISEENRSRSLPDQYCFKVAQGDIEKRLYIQRSDAQTIISKYGDDSINWVGKYLTLEAVQVENKKKSMSTIWKITPSA